jgi:hypothetical protein
VAEGLLELHKNQVDDWEKKKSLAASIIYFPWICPIRRSLRPRRQIQSTYGTRQRSSLLRTVSPTFTSESWPSQPYSSRTASTWRITVQSSRHFNTS